MTAFLAATLSVLMLAVSASSAVAPDPNLIRMTADQQSYNVDKQKYVLSGNVKVAYDDILISGTKAEIEMNEAGKPEVAHFFNRPTFKRVKPQVGEDHVVGDILNVYLGSDRFGAMGNVQSRITTVAADPFLIRSDVQEFDNRNKVVSASGNVKVAYQGSEVFSRLANVRMKDNGQAERVIFSGDALLKKESSRIAGERITVMVDSGNLIAENNVNTNVKLEESGSNPSQVTIRSDYQQYDKSSDTMIASGNVRIVYGDYVATGPKATFKLKGQGLDRIFLTGRPTIVENGRTITADKITITTNPKNFDAVGNVKVNFKTADKPAPAAGGTAAPKAAGAAAKPKAPQLPKDDPSDY